MASDGRGTPGTASDYNGADGVEDFGTRRRRGVRTPTTHPSTQRPTLHDLLRWAAMDTWRARLLDEAGVATTVSQETSLLLVELPNVRRILDLVGKHKRLARRYVADAYSGRITLFRAKLVEPHDHHERQLRDPAGGWGKLAIGGVETLAHELSTCLEHSCEPLLAGADHPGEPPETRAVDTVETPGASHGACR